MRDANLSFHDGTTMTGTVTPTSLTRADGSAVLDVGKSGAAGLWVQVTCTAAMTGSGGTVTPKVQYCADPAFGSGVEDGPTFPAITTALGAASIGRVIKLCQSKLRYWRVLMTGGGTETANTVYADIVSGPQRDTIA